MDNKNPTSASADSQNEDLIRAIQHSYASVSYPETKSSPQAASVAQPRSVRGRGLRLTFALAASFVVIASLVFVSLPSGETAWAATPEPVSATQAEDIRKACEENLNSSASSAEQPLEPATVVDYRGKYALSVYRGQQQDVVCVTHPDGTAWTVDSVSTTSLSDSSMPGLLAESRTEWTNGESIAYISGYAPEGTTAVTLSMTDGTAVEASLKDGFFVVWFPADKSIDPASVSFK